MSGPKVDAVVGQRGETVWCTATCGQCGWIMIWTKALYCRRASWGESMAEVYNECPACPAFVPRELGLPQPVAEEAPQQQKDY